MTFENDKHGRLVITLDDVDMENLNHIHDEEGDEFDCDEVMHHILDQAVLDAGYDWVQPEDIGALTSAPILGTMNKDHQCDEESQYYGFMDYQIISLQRRLMEDGKAILQGT